MRWETYIIYLRRVYVVITLPLIANCNWVTLAPLAECLAPTSVSVCMCGCVGVGVGGGGRGGGGNRESRGMGEWGNMYMCYNTYRQVSKFIDTTIGLVHTYM